MDEEPRLEVNGLMDKPGSAEKLSSRDDELAFVSHDDCSLNAR